MKRIPRILCAVAVLGWPQGSPAQEPGWLTGTVVDAQSGDGLVGATVVLAGTQAGSVCDLQGGYRLDRVPPGTYAVVVTMIGYRKATASGVVVQAGAATILDLALQPETIAMEEVVVETRVLRNNEASLLRQRQKAPAVSDALSAEMISRAGSSDAADAMKHVTGASVVDGKYVVIRGLGDRYSTVQLNGATLPSADPDKRTVPMDLFPASLLENIITVKSSTPDRPGNFTGGSIDLGTKRFPDEFTLSLAATTAYNTQTTFSSQYLGSEPGRWDWLGIDDGTREIPAAVRDPAAEVPDIGSAFTNSEKAHQLDQVSRAFSPAVVPTSFRAPLNHSYSLAVGNQFQLWDRPLGFLATCSYSRSFASYEQGTAARWGLKGQADQVSGLSQEMDLRDARSSTEVLWGNLVDLSYKPGPYHELRATYMYNRNSQDQGRFLAGSLPRDLPQNAVYQTRVLQFTKRDLQSLQLHGEHQFSRLRDLRVWWMGSRTITAQDEPDLRFFTDNYLPLDRGDRVDTAYAIDTSLYPSPNRYFRNLDESNQEVQLDVSIPFRQWSGSAATLKIGGSALDASRRFRERRFEFRRDALRYDGQSENYLADARVGLVDSTSGLYRFGSYVVDATQQSSNYDGEQRISAGYGMLELPLLRPIRLVAGARLESTDLEVVSQSASVAPGQLTESDWLPSANLVWEIRPSMNLRAAYGRTLARPTFRELAPYASFDFVGDFIFVGNPDLDRTLIDNYDVRWECFPTPGEIAALSVFAKYFRHPIERAIRTLNGEAQFQNVDHANVYGVEMEWRRGLAGFYPSLANLFAGANFSLVHSRVSVPAAELATRRSVDPRARDTRALQGQSPFLLNLDLSYEHLGSSTSAGLYFNLFGRRLSEVSLGGTPDVYETARGTLDFTFSRSINHAYRLKVAAKNLLDSPTRKVYPFQGREYIAQEYRTGRSFSVGLSYDLHR